MNMKSVEVFCCYSRKDRAYLKQLETHLSPLKREGLLTLWHDGDIDAGSEWDKEIHLHLHRAQIILLLISADFIDSNYCWTTEMQQALKRHERGEANVIPIIVRPVLWQHYEPLSKLQALPEDALPITKWPDPDDAYTNIAEGLRRVIKKRRAKEQERSHNGQIASPTTNPNQFPRTEANTVIPNNAAPAFPFPQPAQLPLPRYITPVTERVRPQPQQTWEPDPIKSVSKRGISRRTVVRTMMLTGLATTGIIGGRFVWELFPHPVATYHGHTDTVYAVAWSPDSQRIASGSLDNTIQIWDATSGRNIATHHSSHKVFSVAWSRDGKYLASGGDSNEVQVWNAATGESVYSYFTVPHIGVEGLSWSPDSQRIVLGGDQGTVQTWDATTGQNVQTYPGGSNEPVFAVAWSPKGNLITAANGANAELMIWDVASSGHRSYPDDWVIAAAWSPDERYIVSGDLRNTVQVWNMLTGENIYTYRGHSNHVNAVAWSPDGKRIASGSGDITNNGRVTDSTVQVWDAFTGANVSTYRGHSNIVQTLAWSPNGKLIASGSWDKTVQVWSADA